MNNLTKGSIAAAAAGVLLLGGLGSVAYWSDSQDVDGGKVTAGTLSLGAPACDDGWVYAAGNAGAEGPVTLIVPGDTITKDCTFVINATGDNLEADLTIPATTEVTGGEGTSLEVEITAVYAGAGTGAGTPSTITSANDGEAVTATIEVAFPFGTNEEGDPLVNANDMQDVTATLNAIPITLTQTDV